MCLEILDWLASNFICDEGSSISSLVEVGIQSFYVVEVYSSTLVVEEPCTRGTSDTYGCTCSSHAC